MNTIPPTDCPSWQDLSAHAESVGGVHLRELFAAEPARASQLSAQTPGVRFDYSRQRIGAITLRLLSHLANERGLGEWRAALLSGQPVNATENRAAWHTALRAATPPSEVKETLARMRSLATRIREEKRYKRIVNLGTGGSDLGPRLLVDALASAKPRGARRSLRGQCRSA